MLGYLVRVFYDYSSPTRASLGLGTYALRPQRDIAHGERASCKTLASQHTTGSTIGTCPPCRETALIFRSTSLGSAPQKAARLLLKDMSQVVLQGEIVAAEAPPPQPVYAQQPVAQPVYVQQPAPVVMPPAAPQTVQVQIPAGMMPGSVFDVQANGQRIRVTVPAGGKAGQLLNVRVPQQRPIGR